MLKVIKDCSKEKTNVANELFDHRYGTNTCLVARKPSCSIKLQYNKMANLFKNKPDSTERGNYLSQPCCTGVSYIHP